MGRWRATFLILNYVSRTPFASRFNHPSRAPKPLNFSTFFNPSLQFVSRKRFSAIPFRVPVYTSDSEYGSSDFCHTHELMSKGKDVDEEECVKIPVKAYFLCTSIDLKSMQAENLRNVVPPSSRSSNYIALRYCNLSSEVTVLGVKEKVSSCRYMVVFQYGSTVLFNIEDNDVESYLEIVRRHASGLLPEVRKDDFAVKEQAQLAKDMQGEPDCIVLKTLDIDSIRIIGSVLGQSIALDYFVSQVDGMVEEFASLNRAMEKTGTFTMDRKKLIQLVGKANSNLAGVILKVGLFDRSEIAWRDAKYALIYEYLREEYEVNQRFGNLDFKLKFVEHNIQFLQEVIQNRRSDLVEWCIIFLLAVENILSIYEIVRSSTGGAG